MKSKRFRIALTFAGEKRDYVSKVAAILAKRFGKDKILYDKYHNPEFSRSDLAFYLPDLYEQEADLIVAVFCPEYDKKEWPGLEWNAIYGLLKKRKVNEIMLTRFGGVEGKGLHGLAGYTDLDNLTPKETAHNILERLALNEGKAADFYIPKRSNRTSRSKTPVPNNLLRLESFFGRREELEKLARILDPQTKTWGTLIAGPGGMGKTSLAIRAAYDCTTRQFDRIVFLSAKIRELDDDGERELGTFILPGFLEMQIELAGQLGRPDIKKNIETNRNRLILEELQGTRTLLILDNLESLTKKDRDKLLTFVKRIPEGCKAILTSRRRIGSGPILALKRLDQGAALETLAELAGHNTLLAKSSEADRKNLYFETGGNPLLLRWTVGQLGRGSCRTLQEAVAFLRSCPHGNDPLEFVFGELANEFSQDETTVLAVLSYFTQPASVEAISDIGDVNVELVNSAFKTLTTLSVVVPNQDENAFALVPMVGDLMKHKQPKVVSDIGNRLQRRAYSLVIQNGFERHRRFPVLDAAWPTISPALPLFVEGSNDRLQMVCNALQFFMEFTGRWDERLSLLQHAEKKAGEAGDYFHAGWRAAEAGWVRSGRNKADEVLNCAERAAAWWQRGGGGRREQATTHQLRGIGYQQKGDYGAAIMEFRKALKLDRSLSTDSIDVGIIHYELAIAEGHAGDFNAAERDYQEALRIALAAAHPDGVAAYTTGLGMLAIDQKKWSKAKRLGTQGLELSNKIGRQQLIALNHLTIAKALLHQAHRKPALAHAELAAEIFRRLDISSSINDATSVIRKCKTRRKTRKAT